MILLDSDILVDVWRDYEPAVNWMNSINDELLISGFTYLELIDGCENQKAIDKLKKSLSPYSIVWLSTGDLDQASETYSQIKLKSGIDFVDCLIGYTAISLNLPLHTFNERHFKAIPQLKIIKPYKKS